MRLVAFDLLGALSFITTERYHHLLGLVVEILREVLGIPSLGALHYHKRSAGYGLRILLVSDLHDLAILVG